MPLRKKMDRTLNKSYLYLNIVAQCLQARRDLSRSARLNALVTRDALSLLECACLFRNIFYTGILFFLIFFLILFLVVVKCE